MSRTSSRLVLSWLLLLCLAAGGCATLSQVTALSKVRFDLDRVTGSTLAGVRLEGKGSYRDLDATDLSRLASAVASRHVPLEMTVHLNAQNPASNPVAARLLQLDWTLLVKDKETISGRLSQEFILPPGEPTDVPVAMQLDLWEFFARDGAEDLFTLAQSVAGAGAPTSISLRATPTIQTSVGPIRYPGPITIVHEQVGAR